MPGKGVAHRWKMPKWPIISLETLVGGAPVRERVQLVYNKYYNSLGLMNGGYIELVIGIINQQTSLGGHHLEWLIMVEAVQCESWEYSGIVSVFFHGNMGSNYMAPLNGSFPIDIQTWLKIDIFP